MGTSLFFLVSIFLLTLLPSTQWASRKAENRMVAETILNSELESLRGESFSRLLEGARPIEESRSRDIPFQVLVEISTEAGFDPNLVKKVKVTVSWVEGDQSQQVEQSALIGKLRP